MRAGDGADDVERVRAGAGPVAEGFVHRVLERGGARGDGDDLRAEQFHAADVGRLAADVFRAHEDLALEPEAGGDGGGGDAVLAGAGLGDDAFLAHAAGEEALADDVVDLVRAGVGAVLALEPEARAAELGGEAFGAVERRGPAGVVAQHGAELGHESGVVLRRFPRGFDVEQRGHEGFADEAAAVGAEVAGGIRIATNQFIHGAGRKVEGGKERRNVQYPISNLQ